jgi:hypothetical protein
MVPDDEKPTGHSVPRAVWRSAFAVASIVIVGFGTAVMTAIWLLLH